MGLSNVTRTIWGVFLCNFVPLVRQRDLVTALPVLFGWCFHVITSRLKIIWFWSVQSEQNVIQKKTFNWMAQKTPGVYGPLGWSIFFYNPPPVKMGQTPSVSLSLPLKPAPLESMCLIIRLPLTSHKAGSSHRHISSFASLLLLTAEKV